jgi:hypothetical protein
MLIRTLRDLTPAERMVVLSLLLIILTASLGWR